MEKHTPRDRTGMNLPTTQECINCHIVKPQRDFALSPGNRFTKERGLPPTLNKICKRCKHQTLIANKKLRVNTIRIGERPISDRLIEKLQAENSKQMDKVIESLLSLLESKSEGVKLEAIRTIIDLTQTKMPTFRVPQGVTEKLFDVGEPEDEAAPRNTAPPASDLLSLLTQNESANT